MRSRHNFVSVGRAAACLLAAGVLLAVTGAAQAQSLTVLPVNIQLAPHQMATVLTVINRGTNETSVQVRTASWSQPDGADRLAQSDDVLASPPIATIAPGGTQLVRIVLRRPPGDKEATYRILVDQIPTAAEPGTVRVALRLSIPIFVQPAARIFPRVHFAVESGRAGAALVTSNDGSRHEKLRDVRLTTLAGLPLAQGPDASPYILAGATTRRRLSGERALPSAGGSVRLTGHTDAGAIDTLVGVVPAP